jgi:hypothetical protein
VSPVGEAGMGRMAAHGSHAVALGRSVRGPLSRAVTQSGRRAPTHGNFYSSPSFGGVLYGEQIKFVSLIN